MSSIATVSFDGDTGLGFVEAGGDRRLLGCLPPRAECSLPRYGKSYSVGDILPRSQWKDVSFRGFDNPIDDQNGHGACVGFGSDGGFDIARNLGGQAKVDCSPWFNYAMVNGGRDQGAIVEDSMVSLRDNGTPLDSTVPDKAWHKSMIPGAAFEEAKRFRILQAYQQKTFDEMASGIMLGRPSVFGVCIGNRFSPNSEGILPNWDGANVGGHCMVAIGLKSIGGKWYLEVRNSWSTRWGAAGYCFMPESYFVGQRWGVDAYAIVAATDDPQSTIDDVPTMS